jgi:hypothetical protein
LSGERIANLEKMSECPALRIRGSGSGSLTERYGTGHWNEQVPVCVCVCVMYSFFDAKRSLKIKVYPLIYS